MADSSPWLAAAAAQSRSGCSLWFLAAVVVVSFLGPWLHAGGKEKRVRRDLRAPGDTATVRVLDPRGSDARKSASGR